jgi:uncharacterized DUF497 family protein
MSNRLGDGRRSTVDNCSRPLAQAHRILRPIRRIQLELWRFTVRAGRIRIISVRRARTREIEIYEKD